MILRDTNIGRALKSRQRGFLLDPYRHVAAPTDPDWSSVVLSCHANGTNGSATFIDSKARHTLTAAGNAQIDTSQSIFGGASGKLDGTGDWVTAPISGAGDFTIGTGLYTADIGIRPISTWNGATGQKAVIACWGAAPPNLGWLVDYNAGALRFIVSNNSTSEVCTYTVNLTLNTWYRLRVVRSGTTTYLFIGGTLVATKTIPGAYNIGGSVLFAIGAKSDLTAPGDFWFDEARLTKGVARSTANYTLDAAQFPDA